MNLKRLTDSPPGRLWAKMNRDNAFTWAVVLAWNFLLSLFPIALVVAAVLGFGLGFVGVGSGQVYHAVASLIPDSRAQRDTFNALNNFNQKSGIFFLVGLAVLLWSGTGLFRSMEQAFAVIYNTRQRPMLGGILMSVGMVVLLAVLGGLMLVSTTLLGLLNQLPYLPSLLANGLVDFVAQVVIGCLSGFVLFLAIYHVVPNRRMRWRSAWIGAALAGVLFECLSLVFPLYLRLTGAGSGYGRTFGLLFLLMLYFYYVGVVTMLGAEVNSLLVPIPLDQPLGADSSPATGPAPLEAPAPRKGSGVGSRSRGIVALAALWLTGTLRPGPRTSRPPK